MSDMVKICNRVIEFAFYLLFFLTPLIFTPWNYELFEFNKMLVVYFFTIIIVCAWLIKMIAIKKLIFRRTFWDIPLFLFLLSQILSFIFSIDHHTSLWGYYSRFNGGLLSIVCYSLLYWAFTTNLNRKQTFISLIILLANAFLISLYGIAEHFGHSFSCWMITKKFDVDCWVQDVKSRVFATLGQPNWLAAYLLAIMPVGWALTLSKFEKKNLKILTILFSLNLVYFLCLLFTKSRSGLLAFAAAYGIFWLMTGWKKKSVWKKLLAPFLILGFSFLTISLLAGTPYTPSFFQMVFKSQKNIPSLPLSQSETPQQPIFISESGDIRKVVWKGAADIWRHHFILGTGPETFAYSYYWYRPREHNDLSEWDFLYNKAHNEYLNFAANTGSIGLVAYLLLLAWFVVFSLKSLNSSSDYLLHSAFLASFVSILITNFFGFSVVIISLLTFILPAASETFFRKQEEKELTLKIGRKPDGLSSSQYFLVGIVLLLTCYSLFSIGKYWQADYYFSKGEKQNKAEQYDLAFDNLKKAIKAKPNEPVYHDEQALVSSNLAVLAKENSALATEFAQQAISESDFALNNGPYNLNFWKTRTKLFYKLVEIDPKYLQEAFNSLLKASELAPTDAKIKYNLSLIYSIQNQISLAIEILEQTVKLKPNYEDARYALAIFYGQTGEKNKAREQLEYILTSINPGSQKTKEKLKDL